MIKELIELNKQVKASKDINEATKFHFEKASKAIIHQLRLE